MTLPSGVDSFLFFFESWTRVFVPFCSFKDTAPGVVAGVLFEARDFWSFLARASFRLVVRLLVLLLGFPLVFAFLRAADARPTLALAAISASIRSRRLGTASLLVLLVLLVVVVVVVVVALPVRLAPCPRAALARCLEAMSASMRFSCLTAERLLMFVPIELDELEDGPMDGCGGGLRCTIVVALVALLRSLAATSSCNRWSIVELLLVVVVVIAAEDEEDEVVLG